MVSDNLKELMGVARLAYEKNFVSGSGGNLSILCEGKVYITATGAYLGDLTEADFTCLDFSGNILSGRKPSKEARMHIECYRKRPDIRCVIHLHPAYSIAATCMEGCTPDCGMPVYTPGYAMRICRIPVIPYYMPGSTELAVCASDGIALRDSLLLKNHGLLVVGETPKAAFGLAEEIEENAKITVLLGGKGSPLNREQIDEISVLSK